MRKDFGVLGEVLDRSYQVYEQSVRVADGTAFALVRGPEGKRLFLSKALPGFLGEEVAGEGSSVR